MAKFKAKKIDLDLELTTLYGEEVIIKSPPNVSAAFAEDVVKKYYEIEKKYKENDSPDDTRIDLIVDEILVIYYECEKDKKWWKENFDFTTLNDILTFASKALSGLPSESNS